jgi:hypothetical protein
MSRRGVLPDGWAAVVSEPEGTVSGLPAGDAVVR